MDDLTLEVNLDIVGDFDVEVDGDESNWRRKTNSKVHDPVSAISLVPGPVQTDILLETVKSLSFGD